MNERANWPEFAFQQKTFFAVLDQFFPRESVERVLKKGHTFVVFVVEKFPVDGVVGDTHLPSVIYINNMNHFDSISENWKAV